MTQGFGTSVEEMQAAAQHVLAVNDTVQNDLATLRARLAPLAGAWRGRAATEFANLMARWEADAKALNDALRGIGESIRGSGVSYQAQEDQQAGDMSAIRAALG
ncbi:MAG TPA: WXG100 family type VII secretion target [Pseudonocardia sp.]|jgi:WXG100 family type VII secretion target|uniref:WXG100 family type VII secretion target n=1 Tax=Pseudonocardia sp. TaxID=60912 RepID=UPI002B4ABDDC|nr:WXG100 family type VII secretion target [Pseudonocardia sp.]HLU54568.1 WXG100 family type VII secretion target [Pseudonocardia sp.]